MGKQAGSDETTDESLMQRYAGGEMAAFEQLYQRHEMRVWRYLYRHVGQQELADDLMQDVWFAVARQAPRYQPSAAFSTWLFTLAHNRLVDSYRTNRPHLSLDADGADDEPPLLERLPDEEQAGPLGQLQSREQATALLAAIGQLPAVQREAFLLQAEGGLGLEEIAAATGAGMETVKSRLRYARAKLRQLLQEYA